MSVLHDMWGTVCIPETSDRIVKFLGDPRKGGAILLLVLVKVLCYAVWHRLLLPLSKISGLATQEDSEDDSLEAETVAHEMFSCAICLEEHRMEDCYIASMCGHRMCRNAAREVVLGAVRSSSFPVLCPICQAKSEQKCIPCSKRQAALAAAQKPTSTHTLLHRISALFASRPTGCKETGRAENIPSGPSAWCCTLDADVPLLLTVKEGEQYLRRSLKAAVNSCADLVQCPQPNCEGMAVAGGEGESPALMCNACRHEWCGQCNVDWHRSKTCQEYQLEVGRKEAEKGLKEYRKEHRMINCPTCNHGIEKISGCNQIWCSGCRASICWECGEYFTPQHYECSPRAPGAHAAGPRPARGAPAQRLPAPRAPAQVPQQATRWAWPWQQPVLPAGGAASPVLVSPRANACGRGRRRGGRGARGRGRGRR